MLKVDLNKTDIKLLTERLQRLKDMESGALERASQNLNRCVTHARLKIIARRVYRNIKAIDIILEEINSRRH